MTLGFPGEDSIRADSLDAHMGHEMPENHHPGCPLHGMTEEELEDEPGECICYELEAEDAEADAAEAKLDAMEDRYW